MSGDLVDGRNFPHLALIRVTINTFFRRRYHNNDPADSQIELHAHLILYMFIIVQLRESNDLSDYQSDCDS